MPRKAARVNLLHQRDFRGGLNLRRDSFNLAPNESPDLFNVDVNIRGGFRLRGGFSPYILTGAPRSIDTLIDYRKNDGTTSLIAAGLSGLYNYDGTSWDTIHSATNSTGKVNAVTFNNKLYVAHNAYGHVKSWDGATLTSLAAPGYADSFASPGSGKFPNCLFLAVHQNVVWGANMQTEAKYHRVRWSHPGFAEAWRTDDWIDVDDQDGNSGGIRALVPFGDRLLVFKRHAVYAIDGSPPESFAVTPLTKEAGAEFPAAISVTENGVFWWDENKGAFWYDGKRIRNIFEPISTIFLNGKLNVAFSNNTVVGSFGRRVFFSTPMILALEGRSAVTFIYDLDSESWVKHGINPNYWLAYRDSNNNAHLLGSVAAYIYEYELYGAGIDEQADGAGGVLQLPIDAHYQTRWFDGGDMSMLKRWQRPVVALLGGQGATFNVDVLRNYDPTNALKTFPLTTSTAGTAMVWDVDDWNEATWGGNLGGEQVQIKHGQTLGLGRSMALRFKSPPVGDWGVFALTLKFVARATRN